MNRVLLASLVLTVGLTSCTDATESTADESVEVDGSTPALPSFEPTSTTISAGTGSSNPDTVPPATVPDQDTLAPNATVDRVVDGDTIVADINGTRERVRLLGIDTPESVAETRPDQCFGAEASDYLKSLLPEGTEITLIRDEEARDQYDRLLAYVVRSEDQLFINLDLIQQGFAGVLIYSPNDHYEALFTEAETKAIRGDVGLWGVCGGPDVPLE